MNALLLSGTPLASQIRQHVHLFISEMQHNGLRTPGLAVIRVGNDPASAVYVRNKKKACAQAGIHSIEHHLDESISCQALESLIDALNADETIDGILLQLPLPAHLNSRMLLHRIDPAKDVDGFHPYNIGRLALRDPYLRPCTPRGIMHLLYSYQQKVKGQHAVIVGASNIVGRPMALELLLAGATVTICHRFTKHLEHHVSEAQLLVVATGKPGLIPGQWIADNTTVIDVGIHRDAAGKLHGDIDCEPESLERFAAITPVPGGVGPLTVAMLLVNTVEANCYRQNIQAPTLPCFAP